MLLTLLAIACSPVVVEFGDAEIPSDTGVELDDTGTERITYAANYSALSVTPELNALDFNDDTCVNFEGVNVDATTFTVEAWIRYEGSEENSRVPDAGNRTVDPILSVYGSWWLRIEDESLDGSQPKLRFGQGFGDWLNYTQAPLSVTPGEWVHIAVEVRTNEDYIAVYVNGAYSGNASAAPLEPGDGRLSIGCYDSGVPATTHHFNGTIDEVRITNSVGLYHQNDTPEVNLPTEDEFFGESSVGESTALLLHFDEGEGTTTTSANLSAPSQPYTGSIEADETGWVPLWVPGRW